jgi:hypothetical protein
VWGPATDTAKVEITNEQQPRYGSVGSSLPGPSFSSVVSLGLFDLDRFDPTVDGLDQFI